MSEQIDKQSDDYWPKAVVTSSCANTTYPGARIVRVRCPLCGKLHTHGAPDGGRRLGHRLGHCAMIPRPEPGGYIIIDPNDRATAGWQTRARERQ